MLDRWRSRTQAPSPGPAVAGQTVDLELLENAPIVLLVLDSALRVRGATRLARVFFNLRPERVPASLIEVTMEAGLERALRSGETGFEVNLVHHHRTVRVDVLPGTDPDTSLCFITDMTQLRRLETVRQEFVANLSHELKTPLTSLRLAAESLLSDPPAAARRTFAERLIREADHLVAIVDNLRQLAAIETGAVELDLETLPLEALIDEVTDRVRPDRLVRLAIPAGFVLTADRAKLAQTLANLLDNAAKFSPPGSPIEVQASMEDGGAVIRIRDHGPGISPEHWDRVFERFYKVDPARSRDVPGSGLGLAIAKHLVLMHRGRVWTEAARDGGQVFALWIPQPGAEDLPVTSA